MSTISFGSTGNFLQKWLLKHKLLITVILVMGLILISLYVVCVFLWKVSWDVIAKWLREWLPIIAPILISVGTLTAMVYYARRGEKREERKILVERYPLGFENLSVEELRPKLLRIQEDYIKDSERKELEEIKSTIKTIRKPRHILIYGSKGVGKSREAVEIIGKLERSEERNIYLIQTMGYPTSLGEIKRNAVLFFDDLHPSRGLPIKVPTEKELLPSFSEFLETIINFFESSLELNCVIITILTEELEKLSPNILNNFVKLEARELSFSSKCLLTKESAELLKIDISEPLIERVAKVRSEESVKDIRSFLLDLSKPVFTLEDAEKYERQAMDLKRNLLGNLPPQEKLIFDILSEFYQFSIPLFVDAVKKLWCAKVGLRFFKGRKFEKILKKYEGKRIRIKESRFDYCDDSWLSLKSANDPSLKDDMEELAKSFYKLRKKYFIFPQWRYQNYLLFMPLAHELHRHGKYNEAIKFYDYILHLPENVLPPNIDLQKMKSKFLFYKGHAYYSLGKRYWKKAENCYKDSIKLDDQNFFAKHALATLYHKVGRPPSEVLKLLNEITEADEKDLLAYKTKLDILIDTGDIDSEEAKKAYKRLEDLLKNRPPDITTFSGKLTLINTLAKQDELLKAEGRKKEAEEHFDEVVIPQFESLINEIPSELRELKAIIKNTYGCLLYDVLEKREKGIAQLEEAHGIYPKHKYTLHKLATIYVKEGEESPAEKEMYWKRANDYLTELLSIDPSHYPALRSLAELKGKSTDWKKLAKDVTQGKLTKTEFWKKVFEIYKRYQIALEKPREKYINFRFWKLKTYSKMSRHDAIVHHDMGWFLWNVEMKARSFIRSKPSSIPFADVEFRRSIQIEKYFIDKPIPWEIKKHIIVAYDSLGSYLMMTGKFRESPIMINEGHSYADMAIKLSKKWKIEFHSENSFNESYAGKLLLEAGEVDEAIERFKRSINIHHNNLRAWWWLKEAYVRKEDYPNALKCWEEYCEIRKFPRNYGTARYTIRRWMKRGKIPRDVDLLIKYSKKAYELDPNGDINPRNISDYAYDRLQQWNITNDQAALTEAKGLYKLLIKRTLDAIDKNPEKEELYISIIRDYCTPIWKSNKILDNDILSEIENCAKRHTQHASSNKMAGIVLRNNGEDKRALPYLKRAPKDIHVLKSLIECYYALGKEQEAENLLQGLIILKELLSRTPKTTAECQQLVNELLDKGFPYDALSLAKSYLKNHPEDRNIFEKYLYLVRKYGDRG